MRNISDTIYRLSALRDAASFMNVSPAEAGRLVPLAQFGSNPGALRGHVHVPEGLAAGAALVVVLHGCTQTAAGYDIGSGWSQMADRHGFALLFPEQTRQNNPNACFNWFSPRDSQRDSGEALSIRQMIATVLAAHPIDPARVFVTGLSAGGAMTSVMLATYPEVFAGGAIIAGLPYGCAANVPQAFDRMRGHGLPSVEEATARVRRASGHAGPWPTVSVWQGTADATVAAGNAVAIVGQWRALHGVAIEPDRQDRVDGQLRRAWCDDAGREVIEEFTIAGLGHGTPLATAGEDGCGKAAAFMLEAGISSTHHICRFWGLDRKDDVSAPAPQEELEAPPRELEPVAADAPPAPQPTPAPFQRVETPPAAAPKPARRAGVRKVIEDALRAAGLLR